jgi:16S rRNA (guanine966-N2)-methyltransferase
MRIIGGRHKGMTIEAPRGLLSRPPLAIIRESVFNILGDWIVGKSVLDLFAGSGSLGIEALSRDAREAHFVDNAKRCVEMVRRNLEKLGMSRVSSITRGNALDFVRSRDVSPFDLVFVDPPFFSGETTGVLAALPESGLLSDNAVVIARHHRREEIHIPESYRLLKKRKFGESVVVFLKRT